MDTAMLVFGLVLFAVGLLIVVDDLRFRARAKRAIAFVLATERVESALPLGDESGGRYVTRRHVTWKTRFRFKTADGTEHTAERHLNYPPGEVVTVWYDRGDPAKVRDYRSKLQAGWILIVTALIPLFFWVLSLGVLPIPAG